jgi:hypothetical protein
MDKQQYVYKPWALPIRLAAMLLAAGLLHAISIAVPFEGAFKGEPLGWLQLLSLAVFAGIFIAVALVALPFTILLLLAIFKF